MTSASSDCRHVDSAHVYRIMRSGWRTVRESSNTHCTWIHSARSCEHVLQHQLFNYWGRGRFVNATLHGRAKICNKGGLVYCYSINRFRENVCRQGNIITGHSYVPIDNANPLPFNRFNNQVFSCYSSC